MRRRTLKICGAASVVAFLLSPATIVAQVATDGSLGPTVTLNGADIEVDQGLGARVGDNLFHSFDRFSIAVDQQVTFTGDEGIANVISRVTGGEASTIAGTLQSEVGAKGFFFINPSGVIIEESGVIDVPAALHVSNASSMRFDDGSEWSTSDRTDATLTIAAPEAFGFLGASTTGVHINGAELAVAGGATLDVTGVNIVIEDAMIAVPNGIFRAQAAGSATQIAVAPTIEPTAGDLRVSGGEIGGVNSSILFGGGRMEFVGAFIGPTDFEGAPFELIIAGDTLDLSGATFQIGPDELNSLATMSLFAINDIRLGEATDLFVDGEKPGTTTDTSLSLSAGRDIAISGETIVENDNGSNELQGLFFVDAVTLSLDGGSSFVSDATNGVGGFFDIRVANAILTDGSSIAAEATKDGGVGGAIGIIASESIVLDDSFISGSAANGAEGGLIFLGSPELSLRNGASIEAELFGDGLGGLIQVDVGNLTLSSGSFISADVFDDFGMPGAIIIEAKSSVHLSDLTVISSSSFADIADGGAISIRAADLTLESGSSINTDVNFGLSGAIDIDVGNLTLNGGSSISSNVFDDSGLPGAIIIEVTDRVHLTDLSVISSSSIADIADGGAVSILAADLTLESGSSIRTDVNVGLSGAIDINVGNLTLNENSIISSNAEVDGFAGDITILAADVSLSNDSSIASNGREAAGSGTVFLTADNVLLTLGGGILSNTGDVPGGEIVIDAETLILTDDRPPDVGLNDTLIAADTSGAGAAGLVEVTVDDLFASNSFIAADTFAEGDAGNVLVSATGEIFLTDFAQIATRSNGTGDAGIVVVEAQNLIIEENAEILSDAEGFGNSGIIDVDANQLTLRTGASINGDVEDGIGGLIKINGRLLTLSASSISSEATGNGVAGAVFIGVDRAFRNITLLDGGNITTEALQGAGGDIIVNAADRVVLDTGTISTSVVSGGQNGGDIEITVDDGFIVLHQDTNILTTAVEGDGGAMLISMNALYRSRSTRIDASSSLGFDGPVIISGLENPETSEVSVLPSDFLDVNAVVRNPCLAAFLGRSQLQIMETGVSAGSMQGDSPLLDAATAGGLTLVGGDFSASAEACDG